MNQLLDEFLGFVQKKGLHKAQAREQIARVFFSSPKHISTDEIWTRVKKVNPTIGIASVYRTLSLLVESGLAEKREFADGAAIYEKRPEHHHDHLFCRNCGKIVEFENEEIERLQGEVAKSHRFHLLDHKMELYGHCDSCHRTLSRKK